MVGDVVQGGPGDDLIDLGYDERQQTFGSVQRDRLSYKGSAFRVIVTLGSPKGRGHAQGDGRDLIKSHPYLALLGSDQGRRADRVDVRRPDPRPRRSRPHRRDGGRDVLVDGPIGVAHRRRRAGRRHRPRRADRRTAAATSSTGDASADLLTVVHAPLGKTTVQGGPGADMLTVAGLRRGACVNVVGGGGSRRAAALGGAGGQGGQGRRRPQEGRRSACAVPRRRCAASSTRSRT